MKKIILFLMLLLPSMTHAQTGDFCVQDFQPNAVCTANDVRVEKLTPLQVLEQCNEGVIGEVEVVFEALISADGSPNRYDVGVFVDQSGQPQGALSGDSCWHGYLPPPLTANPVYGDYNSDSVPDLTSNWWDGDVDQCGDIESDTQVIIELPPIRLSCVDNSGDGAADVHVCTSWDNNANTTCSDVSGAYPGTNSKCSCTTIEFEFTPTVIELFGMEASPNYDWVWALLMFLIVSILTIKVIKK